MNQKMRDCFTPHVGLHSLFGLGLGVLLATLVPASRSVLLAVVVMVVAVVADAMRKG